MLEVVNSTVEAAKADLELLHAEIAKFEENRMTRETSAADLDHRFPEVAKEIEGEVKAHEWFKSSV
jgi:predicted nuclease with TOPRIM domain